MGIARDLDATALRQPDFVTHEKHINAWAASAADGNVIDTQRDPETRRTRRADHALADLGFSWDRLEKLARTALHDHMTKRRIHLDDDRYQRCLDETVEAGARWAIEYDPARAHGHSFASSCYRRMYPRLIDFLRREHGDQRRGQPFYQVPTKYLPDTGPLVDFGDFDEETAALGCALPPRARWTLEQIGRPIAEHDMPLHQAAANAGITPAYAEQLLDELGHLLGRAPAEEDPDDEFALMEAWAAA